MLHAKCESDGNSTPPKSSLSSPKQSLYYVISPTHDSSYDDNKSSPPQTSPLSTSPMDSPSHNSRHSHSSASSRVSGFTRKWNRKRGWNHETSVIKEEEEYDFVYRDYERCRCLMAVVGLGALFTLSCLIIWGVSRPYQPRVSVESLTIYNFYSGEGSDFSGVPTKMLTVNCSVKMSIHNPATFFGIHFHSTTVNLIFTQITVATGQFKRMYLPRKGHGIVHVNMEGERVPLYGAGRSLQMSATHHKVPLKLDFEIVTRGYVVGKLVTTKHTRHISCSLVVDSRNTNIIMFEEKSCTFE